MKGPAQADLQRWSEDVARDPGSLSFLPLARAYRRQGRRDAALGVCLRGLEGHPMNVAAHGLLALLYLESGDREKAGDEWSMVLRLEPGNFEALRGLGFCHLEEGALDRARQHLEAASLIRPADPAVREALQLIRQRQEARRVRASPDPLGAVAGHTPSPGAAPGQDTPGVPAAPPMAGSAPGRPADDSLPDDPAALFDAVLRGPVLGVLLLDAEGLTLAGRLEPSAGAGAEALGARLGEVVREAARTTTHLKLGAWQAMLLRTEVALLHLAPAESNSVVVVAARVDAPVGWLLRGATQAHELADRFIWSYA